MAESLKIRIQKLEEKLKEARKLAAKEEAALRAKKAAEMKAIDDKKCMLLGSFILEQSGDVSNLTDANGRRFADWLSKAEDRALFGMA